MSYSLSHVDLPLCSSTRAEFPFYPFPPADEQFASGAVPEGPTTGGAATEVHQTQTDPHRERAEGRVRDPDPGRNHRLCHRREWSES